MDWYASYLHALLVTASRLDQADFWCVLVSAANWSKNSTADSKLADVSSQLITVSGYSEKQIGAPTIVLDHANEKITVTGTIPSFGTPARGQVVGAALIYDKRTVNSIVNPLALVLEGDDKPLTGGTFTIDYPTPWSEISAKNPAS